MYIHMCDNRLTLLLNRKMVITWYNRNMLPPGTKNSPFMSFNNKFESLTFKHLLLLLNINIYNN